MDNGQTFLSDTLRGEARDGSLASVPKLGDFRKLYLMSSSVLTSDPDHALCDPVLPGDAPDRTALHDKQPSAASHTHVMSKLGDFGRIYSQLHKGDVKLETTHSQRTRQTDHLLSKHQKMFPCHSTACGGSQLSFCLQNSCSYHRVQKSQGRVSPLLSIWTGNDTQNSIAENKVVTQSSITSSLDAHEPGAISFDRSKLATKSENSSACPSTMVRAFDSNSADRSRDTFVDLADSMPPNAEKCRPDSTHERILSYKLFQQGSSIHIFGTKRSLSQKHESLCLKLVSLRAMDTSIASRNLQVVSNGIHVFLDMSNINISFQNALRDRYSLDARCRFVPLPQLNLEFLTEILVRECKIMALNAGCSVLPNRHEPRYIQQLRDLGYRVDLRERKRIDEYTKGRWSESGGGEASSSDDIMTMVPLEVLLDMWRNLWMRRCRLGSQNQ